MALQTSGPISIGDIRTELGDTGAQGLGDADARTLAGIASGEIGMDDFYGASDGDFVETNTNISAVLRTDTATTGVAGLTLPSDAAAGDFCAITYATRSNSATHEAPTGWDRLISTYNFSSGKTTIRLRCYIFYRVLADTTSISSQFTFDTSGQQGAQLLLWKPADTTKTFTATTRRALTYNRTNGATINYAGTAFATGGSYVSIVAGAQDGTNMTVPSSGTYTDTGSVMQYSQKASRNATMCKTHDSVTGGGTMTIPWAAGTSDQIAVCHLIMQLTPTS